MPDPATNAWRSDLADVALAGRVVVSHYAAPVARELRRAAKLRDNPSVEAGLIADLPEGAPFELLDCRGDWAWGYGGKGRRVGYLKIKALA